MKRTKLFALLILLLACSNLDVQAFNPNKTAKKTISKTTKPISSKELKERAALAKEFFELTGTKKELTKVVSKLLDAQLKSSKMQAFAKLGRQEDKQMQDEFSKEVKEVFQKRLNLVHEINTTLANAYAKEFTKEELKSLISYYKSSVGQKALKIGPKFSKEIVSLKQSLLKPKIDKALKDAIQEETNLKP